MFIILGEKSEFHHKISGLRPSKSLLLEPVGGDHQGLGARSNGFGTNPKTWIREGGRNRVCVNLDFLKSGGCMAWAAPVVLVPRDIGIECV